HLFLQHPRAGSLGFGARALGFCLGRSRIRLWSSERIRQEPVQFLVFHQSELAEQGDLHRPPCPFLHSQELVDMLQHPCIVSFLGIGFRSFIGRFHFSVLPVFVLFSRHGRGGPAEK